MIPCHQAPAISSPADAHDSIKPLNLDTSLKTFLFFTSPVLSILFSVGMMIGGIDSHGRLI